MLFKNLFYISLLVYFSACQDNKDHKPNESITDGKAFFYYDQVDYYAILFPGSEIAKLLKKTHNSKMDSLKTALVLLNSPKSISDTFFISKLDSLNYMHRSVSKDYFPLLDSIFKEKPPSEYLSCAAENVFTDIMIFRKNGSVSGVVKLSYGCTHNIQIVGANANTQNFGQDGQFNKLIKLRP